MTFLQIEELTKFYGTKTLFKNISFVINKGQKLALIAKNGAGKTSLLNIIAGHDIADSGKVFLNDKISVSYLEQEPKIESGKSVIELVLNSDKKVVNAVKAYEEALLSQDEDELETAVETMDILNAWDLESEVKAILTKLKLIDYDKSVDILSGGQKKRLALAMALLNKPDFIILDEPTNHLDFEMIEWLEDYLLKSEMTVLLVTHDRYFLDKICNSIIEIDDESVFVYKGKYSEFLKKREERVQTMRADIAKAKNLLKTESQWMNRQPQARATKAKHRIDNFYKIKEKASKKVYDQNFEIDIEGQRLGKKLIDVYNICKSFDSPALIKDFSYKFSKGEKIALYGNNGVGKTTFLNVLVGKTTQDSGTIEIGETVSVGYFEQSLINMPDEKKLIEVIRDVAEVIKLGKNREMSAAQFAEYFMFPRNMHHNYIEQLSGGEKRRLFLLTVLMKNPNFLILDEPTNDLDIMTLNVLEDYLRSFQGTVLLVSHDRYFIDKVADTLFIFSGDGNIKVFPGNYSAYDQYLKQRLKEDQKLDSVSKPKRVKEKNHNKLSYKEKTEFDELEKELKSLDSEKNKLESYMQSGDYDIEELNEKSKRLEEINSLLDEKEMRWLELSEKI